eukprot:7950359-Ditylum_brightwellii.AAC.1
MVDRASNFSYFHMIWGTTVAETIETKGAYERILREYDHKVEAHYGDNNRFDSEEFQHACKFTRQKFTYCGMSDHHQNGMAELMNKNLLHSCKTDLLHAKRKFPGVIPSTIWPFCLKTVEDRHNYLELNGNDLSDMFS